LRSWRPPSPPRSPVWPPCGNARSCRVAFDPVAGPFLEKLARGKQYVYDGLKSGVLKPLIDRTFAPDATAEAHRYMEANRQKGKIVVTVEGRAWAY
jgi:hypothetical protein